MPVTGNLTTLSADEADLTVKFTSLGQHLPTEDYTWDQQLTAGKEMALRKFREARDLDPLRAVAQNNEDWVSIIALYTLGIILSGNVQAELVGRGKLFFEDADVELGSFNFKYDHDDDGQIDSGTREEKQNLRSIELVRG